MRIRCHRDIQEWPECSVCGESYYYGETATGENICAECLEEQKIEDQEEEE